MNRRPEHPRPRSDRDRLGDLMSEAIRRANDKPGKEPKLTPFPAKAEPTKK